MDPRRVKSAADARKIVAARKASHVKVGVFDVDGILRGKYMAREKFLASLDGGFGFCDVVMGWDASDQLYDNTTATGWHTGYPDAAIRILPETCRELPGEDDTLFFLGEFAPPMEQVCPRAALRRVLAAADKMGYRVTAGFEYEFFVFEETPHSIREKRYREPKPLGPGHFGYSILRNSVHADVYRDILATCERMDFGLEGLHEETGAGVLEAAIGKADGLAAADKAALFKTFVKVALQRRGLMATFMAKWSPKWPGSSGHIHISLADKRGRPLFHDPKKPHGMSDLMRRFVGGQQRLMPEMLAMVASTINSYRRLIPGFWAPTDASVGVDNRTCALRIIPGGPKGQRIEYRVAAADANPYLALAAALASGLWGIKTKAEPEAMVTGNAYDKKFPRRLALPRTLWDAGQVLKGSRVARDYLGDPFVEHFAATREWEEREFRRHISDWELERYFEII